MLWTKGHPVDFEYEWEHRSLCIGVAGDAGAPTVLNKDEAYYLSTRIPDSVCQISYDTDYCNVYLPFAATQNEIINDVKII